jgi:hypothetical protein
MPTAASIGWLPATGGDEVVIAMANPDGSTNRFLTRSYVRHNGSRFALEPFWGGPAMSLFPYYTVRIRP